MLSAYFKKRPLTKPHNSDNGNKLRRTGQPEEGRNSESTPDLFSTCHSIWADNIHDARLTLWRNGAVNTSANCSQELFSELLRGNRFKYVGRTPQADGAYRIEIRPKPLNDSWGAAPTLTTRGPSR